MLGPWTILRVAATQGCVAMSGRTDRSSYNALAFLVALHCRAKFLNNSDRLVPDRPSPSNRVFTFQNVHVCSTDRRRGDPNERIERSHIGNRLLVKHNAPWLNKNGSSHLWHVSYVPVSMRRLVLQNACGLGKLQSAQAEKCAL